MWSSPYQNSFMRNIGRAELTAVFQHIGKVTSTETRADATT